MLATNIRCHLCHCRQKIASAKFVDQTRKTKQTHLINKILLLEDNLKLLYHTTITGCCLYNNKDKPDLAPLYHNCMRIVKLTYLWFHFVNNFFFI